MIDRSERHVAKALQAGKMKRAMQNNRSKIARAAVDRGRIAPMYSPGGVYLGDYPSIPLEGERINETFETIARGLYFQLRGQRFPDGYSFEVLRHFPRNACGLFDDMKASGPNGPYTLGAVFAWMFEWAAEDPGV